MLPDPVALRAPLKRRRCGIRGLLARLDATLAALARRLDAADRRPVAELLDADGVAAMLSVSARSVRAMNAADEMPRPIRVRGRVLWAVAELREWIAGGAPTRAEWEARRKRP